MPKTKSLKDDADRVVTHAELRVIIRAVSAQLVGFEVRLLECEQVRPVDPDVKMAADDLLRSVRDETRHLEFPSMLSLVTESVTESVTASVTETATDKTIEDAVEIGIEPVIEPVAHPTNIHPDEISDHE